MNTNQPDETLGAPASGAPNGQAQQGQDMLGATEPTQGGPNDASLQRDPDEWATGDEPMTGPQRSYLHTLAQQAGRDAPPDDLSKADASRMIDELQQATGRGQ